MNSGPAAKRQRILLILEECARVVVPVYFTLLLVELLFPSSVGAWMQQGMWIVLAVGFLAALLTSGRQPLRPVMQEPRVLVAAAVAVAVFLLPSPRSLRLLVGAALGIIVFFLLHAFRPAAQEEQDTGGRS